MGKTATALRRATTVHRLDDEAEREVAQADTSRLVRGTPTVLIDEWQRIPSCFDRVRRAVDDGAPPGSFLLTGSAIPTQLPAHSGAGRIVRLRMRPMTLAERGLGEATVSLRALLRGGREPVSGTSGLDLAGYVDEILRSGFPAIRRSTSPEVIRAQLNGYLDRIIDRDFPELGRQVRRPATLRRWMEAYAAATSTTASYETIRDAATSDLGQKPTKETTQPYRDVLERLWMLDPLPAWLPTGIRLARLAMPPKHHLADPALAARLLHVRAEGLLAGHSPGPTVQRTSTLLAALFESLVAMSIRGYAQAIEADAFHLRTWRGEHEVDLIVESGEGIVAIEVKLGEVAQDRDVRHLQWLKAQLGDQVRDAVVVTTGRTAYRRQDGIAVVPAALIGP